MEVMFERVAGLDVGKDSVTVCVRTPGAPAAVGQRDPHVQDDDPVAAGVAGLAGRERGDAGGDGVDLDVLEAAVLLLEDGVECWLLNAEHVKNVPGRKTDLLTELPDRSFERCARRSAGLARFRARDQRRGCAAGVVGVGGAAARVA